MSNKQNTSGGIGIGMILFLIFMVLKLTNYITWSWCWVTAPLWTPLVLALVIFAIIGVVTIIKMKK